MAHRSFEPMSENQNTPAVKALLTHTHPDLDAILSIHLMRKHAGDQFPGVESAKLMFTSANTLPGGKTADQLEQEGILTVDTGGGRFDTHPVKGLENKEKWDTCASMLVAEELKVAENVEYRFLLPYTLNHDARGQSLTSREAAHHLLAPHSLIDGLHAYDNSDEEVVGLVIPILEGIIKASVGAETSQRETAERFDRTLAHFLENSLESDCEHLRKEEFPWPEEGQCHAIARAKGWFLRRDLEKLLKISSWLLSGHEHAQPDDEGERRVLLPHAMNGLAAIYGGETDEYHTVLRPLLAAAIQREADWFSAIDEVERSAKVVRGRGISMVTIASKNGLAIKAARYRRGAGAVLYYEPQSRFVTLQAGTRQDGRPLLNLQRIAARMRGAETIKRKGNGAKLPKGSNGVGMIEGWFLHPSMKLLICGSPKAPDARPSSLEWQEIIDIVTSDLRPDGKMPDWFCPEDRCLETRCTLYPLRLANCHAHRDRVTGTPKPGTLGDLFADKLKKNPPRK